MKNYLFFLLVLAFVNTHAQFPTDGDYQSIPSPETPALPALFGSVLDASVPDPIQITRITEYVEDWDWYPHHEYSKIQPWNADASVYKFYTVAIYDAESHEMIRELPGSPLYPTYWSNTNPDILYGIKDNGDIKTYNISTEEISLLSHIYFDEENQIDYDVLRLGPGEGNIDKYDHYVALVGKKGVDMDVIIYDLETHTVLLKENFPGAWGNGDSYSPDYVDWVSISQSGDYVGIMWNHNTTDEDNPYNGHFGVEIYDRNNMQFLRRIAIYGNHGDFGFAADGDEVFVQFWGETGSLNMYYLDRMERIVLQTHTDFGGEGHISCRNLNRPGWTYVSIDEQARTGQILAVKLDDSGLVEPFGHHFTSSSSYGKGSMPVPTPDGDKIMFKSDFGDTTEAVVYTFEARLNATSSIGDENLHSIQIYPNPATTYLRIKTKLTNYSVSILNMQGQKIRTIENLSSVKVLNIDVSDLIPSVYYVNIFTDTSNMTEKFIKLTY